MKPRPAMARQTTHSAAQLNMLLRRSVGGNLSRAKNARNSTSLKEDPAAELFYRAIKRGDLNACQQLLSEADTNERRQELANTVSTRGDSMLIVAITLEYPNVVKLLLANGADPTFKCDTPTPGSTALSVAVTCNRPYIVKMVCEAYLSEQYLAQGKFLSIRELEVHFKTEQERRVARRVLVDIYASMSIEEVVCGVPNDFHEVPGQMLCDLISLAAATERKAMRIRSTEPFTADELSTASARLQLAAAGCLRALGAVKDGLGRFEVDELLKSPPGMHAMKDALRYNLRNFIAQPEVQAFVHREWNGPLLYQALHHSADNTGNGVDLVHQARCAAYAVLAALASLLLLPFVAAFPFVETYAYEQLRARNTRLVEKTRAERSRRGRRFNSEEEATMGGAAAQAMAALSKTAKNTRGSLLCAAAGGLLGRGSSPTEPKRASSPTESFKKRNGSPSRTDGGGRDASPLGNRSGSSLHGLGNGGAPSFLRPTPPPSPPQLVTPTPSPPQLRPPTIEEVLKRPKVVTTSSQQLPPPTTKVPSPTLNAAKAAKAKDCGGGA